jgi:hypothetical protein
LQPEEEEEALETRMAGVEEEAHMAVEVWGRGLDISARWHGIICWVLRGVRVWRGDGGVMRDW